MLGESTAGSSCSGCRRANAERNEYFHASIGVILGRFQGWGVYAGAQATPVQSTSAPHFLHKRSV